MKKQRTILLLEDDMVDAMIVKKAFKKIGVNHPLAVCSNGEEGLAWLSEHKSDLPGLILLDLNMPKMNGLEFLKLIKSDALFRLIPVVVLTTSEDQQDRLESFNLSVAGYMVKSHDYPEFVSMMRQINFYWDMSKLAY